MIYLFLMFKVILKFLILLKIKDYHNLPIKKNKTYKKDWKYMLFQEFVK